MKSAKEMFIAKHLRHCKRGEWDSATNTCLRCDIAWEDGIGPVDTREEED